MSQILRNTYSPLDFTNSKMWNRHFSDKLKVADVIQNFVKTSEPSLSKRNKKYLTEIQIRYLIKTSHFLTWFPFRIWSPVYIPKFTKDVTSLHLAALFKIEPGTCAYMSTLKKYLEIFFIKDIWQLFLQNQPEPSVNIIHKS